MPHYFFHFCDGRRRFTDALGHELTGMAAAREQAIMQIRELTVAMCTPYILDLSGWIMTVVNSNGETVFEIGFDMKPLRPTDLMICQSPELLPTSSHDVLSASLPIPTKVPVGVD